VGVIVIKPVLVVSGTETLCVYSALLTIAVCGFPFACCEGVMDQPRQHIALSWLRC